MIRLATVAVVAIAVMIAVLSRSATTTTAALGSGDMFTTIAPTYDLVNRLIALNSRDLAWREALADSYGSSQPPSTIVDLACGTGDTTLILATKYQSARVTGVDPSSGMLSVARDKTDNDSIKYIEQSALLLILDESVDFVTMSFGIRNIPMDDWQALILSVRSLLRKGGIFSILEVSDPRKEDEGDVSLLAHPTAMFIEHVVPFIGGVVSGGKFTEYNHLQSSINKFPSPTEFVRLMTSSGDFEFVRRENFNFKSINCFVFRAV